jgi:hypothetical protein
MFINKEYEYIFGELNSERKELDTFIKPAQLMKLKH